MISMESSDYIIRATAAYGEIRAFAANTHDTVEMARKLHGTSPVVTAALGRFLTAGAIMGSMMKGDKDILTLQIRSEGPIRGMTVTADSKARVKGYPNQPLVLIPANEAGKLDVGGAVGPGTLYVIKDLGLKEPYMGQVDLQSGEIAEDLAYYYMTSEQVPSLVALGVLMSTENTVEQAGGIIIQLMPDAREETIQALEEKAAMLRPVTDLLSEGMTAEEILEWLLGDLGLEILDKVPTSFYCDCSKERVEKALASISPKDLQEMIEEERNAEIVCHFCNTAYNFTPDDLRRIERERK